MASTLCHLILETPHTIFTRDLPCFMDISGPRWKGKEFAEKALSTPMSTIISQLQSSLISSKVKAVLLGSDSIIEVEPKLAELVDQAAFGRQIVSSQKKQCFQLGPDETFYLFHSLKCIDISLEDDSLALSEVELWKRFCSRNVFFPELYKAYSHFRTKNWVVRSGIQYGVNFVIYRHHPALVHAEYAAIVVTEDGDNASCGRLKAWSDLQCAVRVCGSVAKTLMVLYFSNCSGDKCSMKWLSEVIIKQRAVARWIPERFREDDCSAEKNDDCPNVSSVHEIAD